MFKIPSYPIWRHYFQCCLPSTTEELKQLIRADHQTNDEAILGDGVFQSCLKRLEKPYSLSLTIKNAKDGCEYKGYYYQIEQEESKAKNIVKYKIKPSVFEQYILNLEIEEKDLDLVDRYQCSELDSQVRFQTDEERRLRILIASSLAKESPKDAGSTKFCVLEEEFTPIFTFTVNHYSGADFSLNSETYLRWMGEGRLFVSSSLAGAREGMPNFSTLVLDAKQSKITRVCLKDDGSNPSMNVQPKLLSVFGDNLLLSKVLEVGAANYSTIRLS